MTEKQAIEILIEERSDKGCRRCNNSGVALSVGELSETIIQRCDVCSKFSTDEAAADLVQKLLTQHVNKKRKAVFYSRLSRARKHELQTE